MLDAPACVNFFSAKTGPVLACEFELDGKKVQITGPHPVAANDANTDVEAGLAGLGILQSPRVVGQLGQRLLVVAPCGLTLRA